MSSIDNPNPSAAQADLGAALGLGLSLGRPAWAGGFGLAPFGRALARRAFNHSMERSDLDSGAGYRFWLINGFLHWLGGWWSTACRSSLIR
jgi:hypothetical protein